MNQLTFVTVCMNRLVFLQQTLGAMVSQPGCCCVVVDWSCPQHCGDWVEKHYSGVRIRRVPGHTTFNAEVSRNAGAELVDTPWICFIDADILLDPRFAATVLPQIYPGCYYVPLPRGEGIYGTWIVPAADFRRAGGYDEVFRGYGDEDFDVYDALSFAGCRRYTYPAALLRHLPHSPALRTEMYSFHDLSLSTFINRLYRLFKWELARRDGAVPPRAERQRLYDYLCALVPSALPRDPDTRAVPLERVLQFVEQEWTKIVQRLWTPEVRQRALQVILTT